MKKILLITLVTILTSCEARIGDNSNNLVIDSKTNDVEREGRNPTGKYYYTFEGGGIVLWTDSSYDVGDTLRIMKK